MARIPANKVVVQRRWIVDCHVCHEAVEPESGAFETRQDADGAKQRHLDNHAENGLMTEEERSLTMDRWER